MVHDLLGVLVRRAAGILDVAKRTGARDPLSAASFSSTVFSPILHLAGRQGTPSASASPALIMCFLGSLVLFRREVVALGLVELVPRGPEDARRAEREHQDELEDEDREFVDEDLPDADLSAGLGSSSPFGEPDGEQADDDVSGRKRTRVMLKISATFRLDPLRIVDQGRRRDLQPS